MKPGPARRIGTMRGVAGVAGRSTALAALVLLAWGCSSAIRLEGVSDDPTYGYSEEAPIKVGGIAEDRGPENERRYLEALRGPRGQKVLFKRLGCCCPFVTPEPINGLDKILGFGTGLLDVYEVTHAGLRKPVRLYLDMYESDRLLAPQGFTY
jgi:hypothetical protein